MSKSVPALVKPALLIWGRETIGYEINVAAQKIGVSTNILESWEAGTAHPTVIQLLKIAQVYKRPFAVFYLPVPPNKMDEPFDTLRDWRKLPESADRHKSTGLILELREALRRRAIMLDLTEELGEKNLSFDLNHPLEMPPDELARVIRERLDIGYEDQIAIKTPVEALKMWRLAIEKLNVLVFQTGFFSAYPVDVEEMRGVAIYFDKFPIIIINSKDSYTGRLFTLLHELGHLILRLSGISNQYDTNEMSQEEIFCNEFAGALVVPAARLAIEDDVKNHPNFEWDDTVLDRLARRYSVSREVILRRLLSLERTTPAFYRQKRTQWQEEWQHKTKPEKAKGGPEFHTKFVRCHGVRFVETVFEAYHRGVIPTSRLTDFLGTKTTHLPAILAHLRAS